MFVILQPSAAGRKLLRTLRRSRLPLSRDTAGKRGIGSLDAGRIAPEARSETPERRSHPGLESRLLVRNCPETEKGTTLGGRALDADGAAWS